MGEAPGGGHGPGVADEAAVARRGSGLVGGMIWMAAGAVSLAIVHFLIWRYWPWVVGQAAADGVEQVSHLNPVLNGAWYVSNLFVWASLGLGDRRLTWRRILGAVAGYAVVVWLLWPLVVVFDENLVLVVLAVFVYGGMLRRLDLLGYLYLFLLCQRFLPAYLFPAFLLSALLYTTLRPFARSFWYERERFVPLCHLAGLVLLTALLLPILFFCTQSSTQDINQRLQEEDVLNALGTSLLTSGIATLVVLGLGVPMAYAVVRRSFPGRGLIDTLIDLPIVVPPPIVGIALLAFLGPKSPMGEFLNRTAGVEFFDSLAGIVIAQVFVGSPYLIRASMVAFGAVDVRYENVARTLGGSSLSAFWRITLPMSLRGILIGVILTWFRAMAEYGSLRIMANRPRTIPILAYERYIDYRQAEAQSVGVLVLLLCLAVIVGMWIIRSMPSILGRSIGASDASR